MALTLSKTGISTGDSIEAFHVTQSIDALSGLVAYNLRVSGSFTVTGSLSNLGIFTTTTGSIGYLTLTSGYANYISSSQITSTYINTDIITAGGSISTPVTYTLPLNSTIGIGDTVRYYFIDPSAGGIDLQLTNLPEYAEVCIRDISNGLSGNQLLITGTPGSIYTDSGNTGNTYTLPASGSIRLFRSGSNFFEI